MLALMLLFVGLHLSVPPAAEPDPAPDLVSWRSIDDGEAESRASGRPVLYFFTADWCPPCDALKRTVFSDASVAAFIERNFVPVVVDDVRDEDQAGLPEVEALKFRFLIGRIPSLVVSRADGGPALSEECVPVHSKMVRFLNTAGTRFAELERKYLANGRGSRTAP